MKQTSAIVIDCTSES